MLKEREQNILNYMRAEIREKGYPPTVREICSALDIKSTSTVHKDISNLVKQGYIKKDPSKPRALMLVDIGQTDSHDKHEMSDRNTVNREVSRAEIIEVPLVGRIAAGCGRQFSGSRKIRRKQSQLYAYSERREYDRSRYNGWGLYISRTAEHSQKRRNNCSYGGRI